MAKDKTSEKPVTREQSDQRNDQIDLATALGEEVPDVSKMK